MNEPFGSADRSVGVWQVELFGGLRLIGDGRAITRFPAGKARGLLARLAYFLHRQHPREELIELLWPESEPSSARLRLRVAANSLRAQLEPPGVQPGTVLVAEGDTLRLNPVTVATDADEFERRLHTARTCETDTERVACLTQAVGLHKAELLPGLYDDWVLVERERLSEACLGALRDLVRHEERSGRLELALEHARRAVALAIDSEECHQDVIRLLALSGRKAEAQAQYRYAKRILRERLGSAPLAETVLLLDTAPAPQRVAHPLSQSTTTTKSASIRPTAIAERFVRRPDSSAPGLPRLPLTLTRFFGRETELDDIERMLTGTDLADTRASTGTRLLTLTGPGGIGKTRVSIETARRLAARYANGVFCVPLADLTDASSIPEAILRSVGRPIRATGSPLRQVIDALTSADTREPDAALLILDNLEHLLGTSASAQDGSSECVQPGESAIRIITALLKSVQHLTILTTSRQPLGIDGERVYPIGMLETPARSGAPERLLEFPSVMLFADRAQAVRPDFRVTQGNADAVAALCDRLEGLPLAIELAAAWARVLTPRQILARIERRFELLVARRAGDVPRLGSLQASLEWSYHLLTPAQQAMLARLGVFHGGWTLEAAEAVCQDEAPMTLDENALHASYLILHRSQVLDLLAQLADHSLILAEETPSGMRYRMLESVREFAVGRLRESDPDPWRRRHADWCLQQAQCESGTDATAWLDQMEAEKENMRTAIEWCAQSTPVSGRKLSAAAPARRFAHGLCLAAALFRFWNTRGRLREGRLLCSALMERVTADGTPTEIAQISNLAANLAQAQGDSGIADRLLGQAISLYRAVGDSAGTAIALYNLAITKKRLGDYQAATELCGEALALNRQSGAHARAAGNLNLLGSLAQEQADYAAARGYYEQAVEIDRSIDDREAEATVLGNLANLLELQGAYPQARELQHRVLDMYCELGHKEGQARTLSNLGGLELCERDPARAVELYRQARKICADTGDRLSEAENLSNLAWALYEQGELEAARTSLEDAAAQMRSLGYRRGEATALNKLGCIHQQLGAHADARRCQEKALQMRMDANNRSGVVYSLRDMASLALVEGNPGRAARLAGAAHAVQQATGMVLPPVEMDTYERETAAARAALGELDFARAWEEGHAFSLEEAVAFAVGGANPQT